MDPEAKKNHFSREISRISLFIREVEMLLREIIWNLSLHNFFVEKMLKIKRNFLATIFLFHHETKKKLMDHNREASEKDRLTKIRVK